jgi:hypothetical protein
VRAHLATASSEVILHLLGLGKVALVPDEVLVLLSVLDIEPHHVHGNVGLVELGLHVLHIGLVEVVPSALVVGRGEELWKRSAAGEGGVLLEDVGAAGTEEDEEVEDARLGHPVRRGGGGGRTSVISFCGALL